MKNKNIIGEHKLKHGKNGLAIQTNKQKAESIEHTYTRAEDDVKEEFCFDCLICLIFDFIFIIVLSAGCMTLVCCAQKLLRIMADSVLNGSAS